MPVPLPYRCPCTRLALATQVIGGWEVGLSSMQVGELAELTCSPDYAYGAKGIPPMIPPSSTLRFEVELLSVQQPQREAQNFADDNSNVARTPDAINAAYRSKMAAKEAKSEGLEGLIEWAKSICAFATGGGAVAVGLACCTRVRGGARACC